MKTLTAFFGESTGQDLTEYALLLAFMCLASAAIYIMLSPGVIGVWTTANTTLISANSAAVS